MDRLPDQWTREDIVALSRLGRLETHDRIRLISTHPSLDRTLQALGALDLGLRDEAARICSDAEQHRVAICTWFDEDYPAGLRGVPSPPLLVYIAGSLPHLHAAVAVVGTRSSTASYGKPVTDLLVRSWAAAGCCIVSGLALGIDTHAHEACIASGGRTVAVIASGHGRISPTSARTLAEKIVATGGAVVSEHPWHVAALPPYFPARNRIIVGLSRTVVVVESKDRGGALITAEIARRSERPVWSVPGPITSTRSSGTNMLIARGEARPCLQASDVLADVDLASNDAEQSPLPEALSQLDLDSATVLSLDAIAALWKCDIARARSCLLAFELDGWIEQLAGGHYRLRRIG